MEKLQASQAEAQKVMDVIENPDVIAALRQDKLQNLQFLKDNYGVCIEKISLDVWQQNDTISGTMDNTTGTMAILMDISFMALL